MNGIQVIHYRSKSGYCPKGGVTFAYRVDGSRIRFAVAACHPDENYNKKEGFALAKSRLELSYTFPSTKVIEFHLLTEVQKFVREDIRKLLADHDPLTAGRSEKEKMANEDALVSWQSMYIAITPSRELIESLIVKVAQEAYQGQNPYLTMG